MNQMNFNGKLAEIIQRLKKGLRPVTKVDSDMNSAVCDYLVYDNFNYENGEDIYSPFKGEEYQFEPDTCLSPMRKWKFTYPLVRHWYGRLSKDCIVNHYNDEDYTYNLIVISNNPRHREDSSVCQKYISITPCKKIKLELDDVSEIRISEEGEIQYITKRQLIIDDYNNFCSKINKTLSVMRKMKIKALPELDNRFGFRGFIVSFIHEDFPDFPILTNLKTWWECDELPEIDERDFIELFEQIAERLRKRDEWERKGATLYMESLADDSLKEHIGIKKAAEIFTDNREDLKKYCISEHISNTFGDDPVSAIFSQKYIALFPKDCEFGVLNQIIEFIDFNKNDNSYLIKSKKQTDEDWDMDVHWTIKDGKVIRVWYDDYEDEEMTKCEYEVNNDECE